MPEAPRKKSPRAPSIPLEEALERAIKAYDKERLHAAPTDVVAQNIGYKGANNGAALAAIAALRYYGLLERPKEGELAVSKDVESFRFAPDENIKRALLIQFLKKPPLFAELLDKYTTGLPSDANLKFELIKRGFAPAQAESVLAAFRRSVEFAGYFDRPVVQSGSMDEDSELASNIEMESVLPTQSVHRSNTVTGTKLEIEDDSLDRIPVRLTGGRRAWLIIPTPFLSIDKKRLKAQIDLLLAEDEEEDA